MKQLEQIIVTEKDKDPFMRYLGRIVALQGAVCLIVLACHFADLAGAVIS